MSNLYRGPSIDASYQVSFHLAKRFQRKSFFINQPIRNKNCLWQPCLLMDQNEMINLYTGPSIDASYQASVHLAKRFQKKIIFFRNWPIRNKNCLWRPCLLTNQNEMSNLYRTWSEHVNHYTTDAIAVFWILSQIWIMRETFMKFQKGQRFKIMKVQDLWPFTADIRLLHWVLVASPDLLIWSLKCHHLLISL
jgi:hypothetical protein